MEGSHNYGYLLGVPIIKIIIFGVVYCGLPLLGFRIPSIS